MVDAAQLGLILGVALANALEPPAVKDEAVPLGGHAGSQVAHAQVDAQGLAAVEVGMGYLLHGVLNGHFPIADMVERADDDVADVSVLIAGGQAEPNGGSLTGGGEYQIFPLPWRSLDFNGAQTPLWVGRHEVVQILHHQGIIRLAQSVAVRGDVLLEIRNRRQQNLKVEAAYGLVLR